MNTTYKVFGHVADGTPSPFLFLSIADVVEDGRTKNTNGRSYYVVINAVSKEAKSKAEINNMVTDVWKAMSEEIELPEGFSLMAQEFISGPNIKLEETKEYHATLTYKVRVFYFN